MESIDIIPKIKLNMTSERKIWNEYFSNGLIQIPNICDKLSKNINKRIRYINKSLYW